MGNRYGVATRKRIHHRENQCNQQLKNIYIQKHLVPNRTVTKAHRVVSHNIMEIDAKRIIPNIKRGVDKETGTGEKVNKTNELKAFLHIKNL